MNLFRIITIALITALANPFCCCLLGDSTDSNRNVQTHACCEAMQQTDFPKSGQSAHTPEDCPHRYEKESQISHSSDNLDSLVIPHLYVAQIITISDWSLAPKLEEKVPAGITRAHSIHSPTEQYPQAYCVYIL